MSDKPHTRRVKDAGISFSEPLDGLTDLTNQALQAIRDSSISHKVAPYSLILILIDHKEERQALGTDLVEGEDTDYAHTMGTIASACAQALQYLCRLVPEMMPEIRSYVMKWTDD